MAGLGLQDDSACEYLVQAKTAADTASSDSGLSVTSFIKKQQAPPAGQDTVHILYKKHIDATTMVVRELMEQQLQGSSSIPYPVDGLIFTPYSTSYVLGMENLLCKWQPPQRVAADIQLVANNVGSLILSAPNARASGRGIQWQALYAPPVCGITLEYLPSIAVARPLAGPSNLVNTDSWQPVSIRWDKAQGNGDDSIRDLLQYTQQVCKPISIAGPNRDPGDTLAVMQRQETPPLFVHPARLLPFEEIYARANAALSRGTVEQWSDADTGIEIFNYTRNSKEDVNMAPDDAEIMCRGLVLHPMTRTVLATPFVRFASHCESEEEKKTLRAVFATVDLDDGDDEDDQSCRTYAAPAAQPPRKDSGERGRGSGRGQGLDLHDQPPPRVTASLKVDGSLVMLCFLDVM